MRIADNPVVGIPKNCSKCGKDFSDFTEYGQMRLCPKCKKGRAPVPLHGKEYLASLFGKPLTLRQTQICWLVAEAKLNKEIASDLHLGEGTIKVFMSEIFAKLGMSNRTGLAIYWVRTYGFTPPPVLKKGASRAAVAVE